MPSTKIRSRRIDELDLLRGFFIVIIILDHAQFWPSPLQYLTGQGRLWVSAAEGFFLISGLLIGYLRAYKGARTPLGELSKKLWLRAAMLYVWCVGITLAVVAFTTMLGGNENRLPKLPEVWQLADIWTYLGQVISTHFASDWIYFLRLYAVMLAVTPGFLWLIRRGTWYIAAGLSASIYALSLLGNINEATMQWQVLFFGAALIGWKLETILAWLHRRPRLRIELLTLLIVTTLGTMATSYFFVHGWGIVESPATSISRDAYISIRANVDPLFSNNPLVPLRIGLAFVWFFGLLALFHIIRTPLKRWLGWLLMPFGQASLTAYCLQALILPFIVTLIPLGNFWINGLLGILTVLTMWALLRIPLMQRLLPR